VLRVEERVEIPATNVWGRDAPRPRRYGVVIYRAKGRVYPVPTKDDGGWALPPSVTETRIICVRPSLHGAELPSSAGRYLGSFRQEGTEYWHAFLAKDARESRRPEVSEAPRAAAAPAPARAEGSNRAGSGLAPRESRPEGAQTSTPRSSGQHGRQ
jgi:hypothetical protein